MGWIVNCESETDDELDNDDVVKGQIPVVDKSQKEHIHQDDSEHDQSGHREWESDECHDKEDSDTCKSNGDYKLANQNYILLEV